MSDYIKPKTWPVPSDRTSASALASAFPFDDYRPKQEAVLQQAAESLYGDTQTDTVIIDAPTGVGKSGINTALCNLARGAFYTTPQKALRDQLYDDDALEPHLKALRARADYRCQYASEPNDPVSCADCPINRNPNESCADHGDGGCRYWAAKLEAFDERVAALTFAYLIIDDYLPETAPVSDGSETQQTLGNFEEQQVSFGDRELLVVDEAHQLEEQTASLHVGFTLSPRTLRESDAQQYLNDNNVQTETTPYEVFHDSVERLLSGLGDTDSLDVWEFKNALITLAETLEQWEVLLAGTGLEASTRFRGLYRQITNLREALDRGDDWVVEVEERDRPDQPPVYRVTFKPVRVDDFLANHVWSRVDKVVLSTATLPFRNDPGRWLHRLGLDHKTAEVVSADMPFPPSNRRVYCGDTVGDMSGGGFAARFDEIVATLTELCDHHAGEQGLIHTASYSRAESVADALGDAALAHTPRTDGKVALAEWQEGDAQVLCTPSMMDGVDLPGDKCRWQALLKVPYASLGDPRVDFLVNERNQWDWYRDVAARRVIQSVGRAVRSSDDRADYHVLDECFGDAVMPRAPGWFTDAVTAEGVLD